MEYSTWWTVGGFVCLIMLGLVIVAPGFYFGYLVSRRAREEREKLEAEKQSLRENGGVLAPAIIVSAKSKGVRDKRFVKLEYEVNVQPDGFLPFRAKFRDEVYRSGYSIFNYELMGEAGRKIWVLYDPNNTSRVYLDHYDEQHEEAILSARRAEFNKLTENNEELKKRGEPAEAVITRVDDLELPYPAKGSRAMRIEFKITPVSGASFASEGNFLIGDSAIEKYSVGKKVYVRFDPLKPENAVLDSERNKLIN